MVASTPIVHTNNQWKAGQIFEKYDYSKVNDYLKVLDKYNYWAKNQLQQLQQQLDAERRMRKSMAQQLERVQSNMYSANKSHGYISIGNTMYHKSYLCIIQL